MRPVRTSISIAIAAILLSTGGCFKQNIKTLTVSTPQMKNRECARIIADAMRFMPGVRAIEIDHPEREVVVTYNSLKLAKKNMETAIARAGFDANSVPATPESRANLPDKLK